MSKIVEGAIEPIHASDLKNFIKLAVPVAVDPGVFVPEFVSQEPLVMSQKTLAHARVCAEKVAARMSTFPHTSEAGDLLAMAYAILHYTKES